MKLLVPTTMIAGVLAIVCPAPAQAQWPSDVAQTGPAAQQFYRAVPPEDAYREGLINRWQLEQLTGPTPQALQGPSPNSDKSEDMQ